MSRGKTISVKIATTKVIEALETALDKLNKNWANQEAAIEKYEAAKAEYGKKVTEIAIKQMSKAENLRINTRWNGTVNVDFDLPSGSIKMPKEPEYPKLEFNETSYIYQKEDIENALRILKMTDDDVVSTSTYNAISRYL
jgi:hypothetical protein